MIALRLDDHLLYDSVAFSWIKGLNIHEIIICDDFIANDEFMKMVLELTKPKRIVLRTLTVEQAKMKMLTENFEHINILIITRILKDVVSILEVVSIIKRFNIGFHRCVGDPYLSINQSCFSYQDYCKLLDLHKKGITVDFRNAYDDEMINFKEI